MRCILPLLSVEKVYVQKKSLLNGFKEQIRTQSPVFKLNDLVILFSQTYFSFEAFVDQLVGSFSFGYASGAASWVASCVHLVDRLVFICCCLDLRGTGRKRQSLPRSEC